MKALVLSGAGNFGAMQAGALEVVMEAGFRPDIIVGSSAGALNSIYIGHDPIGGARDLQDVWRDSARLAAGMSNPVVIMRQAVSGADGLVPSETLASFLRRHLPPDLETYEQLRQRHGIRIYSAAVEMSRAELVCFGDDPGDRLLDGAMASTAVPPYLPPWEVKGKRYLDGGVYAKLPIGAAAARGANQVLAIDVVGALGTRSTARGVLGVSGYSLSLMVEAQAAAEIQGARAAGLDLRVISMPVPKEVPYWDFRHPDRLIELGRDLAKRALAQEPLSWKPAWQVRVRRLLAAREPAYPKPHLATD